ncbi:MULTISPECIES: hypothetical protein [unclassified Pseudomonas]|nr:MULTISPECIES: hypothetical protein [unclassified Pseudomonas]
MAYCRISNARPKLLAPITLVRRAFNPSAPLQNIIDLARASAQVYRKG